MGGGKSRKVESTQTVNLPPGLEQGANEVLAAGLRSGSLPYSPNRGVTVSAFTPQQVDAMRGASSQTQAFGLGGAPVITPQAEAGPGGVYGYSTGPMYDDMLNRSISPEVREQRQNILDSYINAAGRVYEEANINPNNPGVGLPGSSPVPIEPTPIDDTNSDNPYPVLFLPGGPRGGPNNSSK